MCSWTGRSKCRYERRQGWGSSSFLTTCFHLFMRGCPDISSGGVDCFQGLSGERWITLSCQKKMSWKEGDVSSDRLFIEFTAPLFHRSAWWDSYYAPSHQGHLHAAPQVTLGAPREPGLSEERGPWAFSFDGQSNKAQCSMTNQDVSERRGALAPATAALLTRWEQILRRGRSTKTDDLCLCTVWGHTGRKLSRH